MRASGSEVNGQGSTEATITATVTGSDSKSVLTMDTDMEVRGKVAQFGRGAIRNVSGRILGQFARNLEAQVLSGRGTEGEATEQPSRHEQAAKTAEASGASATPAAPSFAPDEEGALDMLSVVGFPTLRQAAPAVVGLVLGVAIGVLAASRRTTRGYQEMPTNQQTDYGPPIGYAVLYPPMQSGRNSFGQGQSRLR